MIESEVRRERVLEEALAERERVRPSLTADRTS
jgi:hypothetical protein